MAEGGKEGKPEKDMAESKEKTEQDDKVAEPPSLTGLEDAETTSSWLSSLLKQSLGFSDEKEIPEQLLEEVTFDGIAKFIKDKKATKIVTMAGAGISTSAGIPDFRSPGTGLYDNLQKYNLPHPQAIFEIGFFKENPEPFFSLARELWPGTFKPTPSHYFIKLLHDKGLLLRHYTQNIDTLERVAGLDVDKIVEAHGTFATSHCLDCGAPYSQDWMKERIFNDETPRCTSCCEEGVGGLVKPDIIFFGEKLPDRFSQCVENDLKQCDLLIVTGTSLAVQPFASLCNKVPETTPRLYINLEKGEGCSDPLMAMLGMGHGFRFDDDDNYRDVFFGDNCDHGCQMLAEKLGWGDELMKIVAKEHLRIDKEIAASKGDGKTSAPPKTTPQSPAKCPVKPVEQKDTNSPCKQGPKTGGNL